MNFDLNAASESKQTNYQSVGIHENVKITSVELKKSMSGKPFLELKTEGAKGEVGKSSSMWLTEAAWPVTARSLVDLLKATHNITEEEAKPMIAVANEETLATKVSALLVGRLFRAKFKGEQTPKGVVIALLAGAESMRIPAAESKLYFNESKD